MEEQRRIEMKELLGDILLGILSISIVVLARILDLYVIQGITEIIWLLGGYTICFLWDHWEEIYE